jgi:hypothetical protein
MKDHFSSLASEKPEGIDSSLEVVVGVGHNSYEHLFTFRDAIFYGAIYTNP